MIKEHGIKNLIWEKINQHKQTTESAKINQRTQPEPGIGEVQTNFCSKQDRGWERGYLAHTWVSEFEPDDEYTGEDVGIGHDLIGRREARVTQK